MLKFFLATVLCGSTVFAFANHETDTARVVDLEEIVVISTPKETGSLKQLPAAVSLLGQQDMQRNNIKSLKNVSAVVPNLFIPDYGSRLTSAIYIRGIGSRINTPAVALYVDNVPYFDKSAFEFSFYDIERIDVLRGPQGTLYGRNSMGGLIRVHTRSPFSYQGTDLKLGMATGDAHRNVSVTHYHRVSDRFAFSGGGYYDGSSGFYRNSTTGHRQDKMESGGARVRAIALPTDQWKMDLTLGYDYSHEGGYPYFYEGQIAGPETHAELLGKISNNEQNSYTRSMFNAGLNAEYNADRFTLNAVTGLQHISDRMFLDQDFIADPIYTLEQRQKLTILSEEITLKSKGRRTYQWVNGLSASKQWLRTTGPVTFKQDGVEMLQTNINRIMPDLSAKGMSMEVGLNDDEIVMGGRFQTPVTNLAAFHQSTVNITSRLAATIGVRLDFEHNSLAYNAPGRIDYDFTMSSKMMPLSLKGLVAKPLYQGKLSHDYLEVLPKGSVSYQLNKDVLIYASAAKGHRSGGYNVQMFSDLLQLAMRNKMMQGIKDNVNTTLDNYAAMGMPAMVINMIKTQLDQMPMVDLPDVGSTVSYKPEYSWNYELGSRMSLFDKKLSIDFALFLTTVRNQQIARFADSGLGRMMVNAGRSRSYGVELAVRYSPTARLTAWANYGFTHSKFSKYYGGQGNDYTGNRVPFIPEHTISLGADYAVVQSATGLLHSLTVGANAQGSGRIYWTEDNSASQSLYTTFGAHALLDFGAVTLNVWGKNLTQKHYHAFYFESMNRAYVQKGRPLQVGFDLGVKF